VPWPGGPPPNPGQPPYQQYPPPGWQPPPNVPVRPQPRPAPTKPPRQELRHRAIAANVFGLLSLLSLAAANQVKHVGYLVAFSLIIAVVGLVLGISAARRARLDDTMRPRGSVSSIILGSVAIVLALLTLVGLVFSKQLTTYQDCISSAHSTAAQQNCARNLLHGLESGNKG
jgi:hypothetical protein